MFSFFARPITGISLGTKNLQAARIQQKNGSMTLLQHVEQGMPSEGGEGKPEMEKLAAALRTLTSTGSLSFKRSVILLNAELIYTQLFTFPPSSKDSLQASIHDAISRTIPEDYADLIVSTRILADSKEHVMIGVAAMRKDVLHVHRDAIEKAKITAVAFTTAPCAIIAADRTPKPTSFLLATESLGQTFVTLFHHQWPIDEVILPAESTGIDAMTKAGLEMAEEYKEHNILVDTMFLAGPWGSAPPSATSSFVLKPVFPTFKERSWLATACASALDPKELRVIFLTA